MQYYFDMENSCFYHDTVNQEIPKHAIAITDEQYQELLPATMQNKTITYKNNKFKIIAPPQTEPVITSYDVNMEKNRRLKAGFGWQNKIFQIAEQDTLKIISMASLANDNDTFSWIAQDNSIVQFEAWEFREFAGVVSSFFQHITLKARTLKDLSPIPLDFADDKYW